MGRGYTHSFLQIAPSPSGLPEPTVAPRLCPVSHRRSSLVTIVSSVPAAKRRKRKAHGVRGWASWKRPSSGGAKELLRRKFSPESATGPSSRWNLRIPSALALLFLMAACSPRDFLTRRLATDLIAGSDAFKATQKFWLRTGTTSNQDYFSPESMVLQQRGWITAAKVACPPAIAPRPCWDVALTPLGVGVFRDLIPANAAQSQYFSVPVAHRSWSASPASARTTPWPRSIFCGSGSHSTKWARHSMPAVCSTDQLSRFGVTTTGGEWWKTPCRRATKAWTKH